MTKPTGNTDTMQQTGSPASISFRNHGVFSRRFLSYIAIIAATVALTVFSVAPPDKMLDWRFLAIIGVYFVIVVVLFMLWRLFLKRKGGVPPIRFELDHLLLPAHIHSYKVLELPYADILSVTKQGTRYARLTIEGKKYSFIYPLKEFVDADAFERVEAELQLRIQLLAGGAAQLGAMKTRRKRADFLTRIHPFVTWAIGALITAIFIFQTLWTPDHPLCIIDMGANAGALTFAGEWYRLISANLLHANATHIFNNLVFLFILGPLAERLLGWRRYLLLILATGILSQLASACWNHSNAAAFSVGISGALFGILGALAVLNHRFRYQLPGGFRLAARFWWIMLGLNFVVTPFITDNVDFSAHIGGLIAGAIVGWLLCRTQQELTAPPKPDLLFTGTLVSLSALWGISLVLAGLHVASPAIRLTDYEKMIATALVETPNVVLDNQLAWAMASDPAASDAQLRAGLQLAGRTVQTVKIKKNVPQEDVDAYSDTLATLYYRTGNLDAAIETEETLRLLESDRMSQMARFLDRYLAVRGRPQMTNIGVAMPTAPEVVMTSQTPQSIALIINLSVPLPQGGTAYLLAHAGGRLTGMLLLQLPPGTAAGSSRMQLSLPKDFSNQPLVLTLAKFDDANLSSTKKGVPPARFYPMDNDVAKLP